MKFPIFLFFFLGFLLAANASIHTVLNDDIDNPRIREAESCREQMEMQDELNHCARFVMESCQSGRGGRGRGGRSMDYNQQHFRQCCRQLEMIDEGCRCESLEIMMRDRLREQIQGHQMREAMRCVQDIPMICGIRPMYCDFGRMFYKWV